MTQESIRWSRQRIIALAAAMIVANAVLLFAVFPRLSEHLATSPYNQDRVTDGYDDLAENLAAGNGYRFYSDTARTLMREPGYPILLAGIRLLFGSSLTAVKLVNMFLALYEAVERERPRDYLICGLVLGLSVIVRSVLILFPIFLLAYLLLVERHRWLARAVFRNIALMVLAMLAVLSPWIIRNYSLTGKFVPTASVLGVSAQAGQYISSHLSEGKPWWLLDREAGQERGRLASQLGYRYRGVYYQCFYRTEDEIAFSSYLLGRVVSEYKGSPTLFVEVIVRNLFNFWFAGKTPTATALNIVIQFPYLVLGGIGIVVGFRNHKTRLVSLIVLLLGYIVAIYVPILAQARYSIPLVPFLSILGGLSLVAAKKVLVRRGTELEMRPAGIASVSFAGEDGQVVQTETEAEFHMSSSILEQTKSNLEQLDNMIAFRPKLSTRIDLSIVIPAYNEQERLPRTLLETLTFCIQQDLNFEIIVSDDGSQDATLELTRLFENRDPRVRALRCPHLGKGSAVRMGMLEARGEFVLFMDADGATPLTEVSKLIAALEAGNDVAVGSRALHIAGDVKVRTSLHRRFIGRVFAFFVNVIAVGGISDTQCGFKMFKREAATAIFSLQKTPGFAFDVEILFIARRLGFTIVEVPVNWVAQPGSKVDLVRDSAKMLWDITQIHWIHRKFSPGLSSARNLDAKSGAS